MEEQGEAKRKKIGAVLDEKTEGKDRLR